MQRPLYLQDARCPMPFKSVIQTARTIAESPEEHNHISSARLTAYRFSPIRFDHVPANHSRVAGRPH